MRNRIGAGLLLLTVSLVVAACASSGGGSAATYNVQIRVDNNLQGITGISAYLFTETGSRRSLGPVESNRTGTFDRSLRQGDYYLSGTRVGNPDIVSERFRVDTDSLVVMWNVALNQVTFGRR